MRQVNMLPDKVCLDCAEGTCQLPAGHLHDGSTSAFFRALEDADDFVHAREERDALLCRCDELEVLVEQIKALHAKVPATYARSRDLCGTCGVLWPCPTMKLIGA